MDYSPGIWYAILRAASDKRKEGMRKKGVEKNYESSRFSYLCLR
jgi:hypothetical protein